MSIAIISSLIIIDLIVVGILALFAFHGYRRGGIRSLLSLFLLFVVVLISMVLYERPAIFFQVMFDVSSPLTKTVCFSIIFIFFYALSRVLYFILSKLISAIAIRGFLSALFGSFFSVLEAVILISIVFMNISFFSTNPHLKNSLSFSIMKNIPENIKEKSLWFLPKDDLSKYEEYLRSKKEENSKQQEIK